MHRLFDDSKAYYHYSAGTGVEAGKWFVRHGVKAVAMDSQALDHPLHTAMGNNGMTRMNLLGATGKPITEEYKELFGEEAYSKFDKFEYIRLHGQEAYDELYGDLEEIGIWGTWEPCHKEMLGHGIVGGIWAMVQWLAALHVSMKKNSTMCLKEHTNMAVQAMLTLKTVVVQVLSICRNFSQEINNCRNRVV